MTIYQPARRAVRRIPGLLLRWRARWLIQKIIQVRMAAARSMVTASKMASTGIFQLQAKPGEQEGCDQAQNGGADSADPDRGGKIQAVRLAKRTQDNTEN